MNLRNLNKIIHQTMEYQRVNEIFREYMSFCYKNLVTDIIALYEIVPNEDVCSLVLKKAYI